MSAHFILSESIDGALDRADFDTLEDGPFAGSIPACPGVIAFAGSLRECGRELRSVL